MRIWRSFDSGRTQKTSAWLPCSTFWQLRHWSQQSIATPIEEQSTSIFGRGPEAPGIAVFLFPLPYFCALPDIRRNNICRHRGAPL